MLTKLLRAAGAMVLAATLVSCSDGNMLAPTPGELRLTTASTGGVVISQVYGGGGNSGSVYKNDFIELFNSSASPVSLAGWSVQYASTTGTSWQVTALSGTIAPGGYFLVQEAAGTGGTTALPAANVVGTIPMGATGSKVALVSSTTALTGSCPLGPSVIDFVGSGTAN
jgi:predicted extracellular nuclease